MARGDNRPMKTRIGFVSNSSSSSFVIPLEDVSAKQLRQIQHHDGLADKYDAWCIEVDDDRDIVRGTTTMDNFDMYTYLRDRVKVNMGSVKWSD